MVRGWGFNQKATELKGRVRSMAIFLAGVLVQRRDREGTMKVVGTAISLDSGLHMKALDEPLHLGLW